MISELFERTVFNVRVILRQYIAHEGTADVITTMVAGVMGLSLAGSVIFTLVLMWCYAPFLIGAAFVLAILYWAGLMFTGSL
jgi:hypothetical protein